MKTWPDFSFAFQPIVNVSTGETISYEALVRGVGDTPASGVFQQVSLDDKYNFDEVLRFEAIRLAASLGLDCQINLNFLPQSLTISEDVIGRTLNAARRCGWSADRLILEVTETEVIHDRALFAEKMSSYRTTGLSISIDDFGAGYSGLNLLADFLPDQIKIDMALIRNIHLSGPRQAIVRGIIRTCLDLGIDILAEGVESIDEYQWCFNEGIEIFQGYFFGRPLYQQLMRPAFQKNVVV